MAQPTIYHQTHMVAGDDGRHTRREVPSAQQG